MCIRDSIKSLEPGMGFDAVSEEYVDMFKSGIVDPTKVTRSALENAVSVASMVITTEAAVADIEEDDPMAAAAAMGGMGGMGMM